MRFGVKRNFAELRQIGTTGKSVYVPESVSRVDCHSGAPSNLSLPSFRGVRSTSPESITMTGSMDSGSPLRGSFRRIGSILAIVE